MELPNRHYKYLSSPHTAALRSRRSSRVRPLAILYVWELLKQFCFWLGTEDVAIIRSVRPHPRRSDAIDISGILLAYLLTASHGPLYLLCQPYDTKSRGNTESFYEPPHFDTNAPDAVISIWPVIRAYFSWGRPHSLSFDRNVAVEGRLPHDMKSAFQK